MENQGHWSWKVREVFEDLYHLQQWCWWFSHACLKSCYDSSCLPKVWLSPHPENNSFNFSSAVQTSCNFLSKGNSTQNEIGKGSLGNVISQTLEGCDYDAELAADNPSQHPYPVSDVSMLAHVYWWPIPVSHCAQYFICVFSLKP